MWVKFPYSFTVVRAEWWWNLFIAEDVRQWERNSRRETSGKKKCAVRVHCCASIGNSTTCSARWVTQGGAQSRISDRSWWKIGVILSLKKHCSASRDGFRWFIINRKAIIVHMACHSWRYITLHTSALGWFRLVSNVRSAGDFESSGVSIRTVHLWWRIRQQQQKKDASSTV